jgi:hypothetical protein
MSQNDLFDRVLEKRKHVLGDKYVDANLAGSDAFMMTFQRAVTELLGVTRGAAPDLTRRREAS